MDIMDNDELVTYVSHLIDAYTSISRRMEKLENEVETLRAERDGRAGSACKMYKMEIHRTVKGKNV